jgi:selenocysteine-specific elongation factor
MIRRIIGTAGHIDHGKTALVKALTGIDTDRLKEEKEREITIDLGFAFLNDTTAVIDAPGHERFVKNMVAGVTGIDLALLVIAADDGIMPQTREHLDIIRLLSIKKLVVAITKSDLVDSDWLQLLHEEIDPFLSENGFPDTDIITVSSITGEGVEELKKVLLGEIAFKPGKKLDKPFRMPVDRSFTMKGFGTVLTGSVMSGSLKLTDQVEILPAGKVLRLRGLQRHNEKVDLVQCGDRAALNFSGIQKDSILRGNVVAQTALYKASTILSCFIHFLAGTKNPLKHRDRIRFHCGTIEVLGRIILLGKSRIEPGESVAVQFKLEKPVVAASGDLYIIRRYSPALTIGGGEVIEIGGEYAEKNRAGVAAIIEKMYHNSPEDRINTFLESKNGQQVSSEELGRQFGLFPNQIDDILSKFENTVIRFKEDRESFWVNKISFEKSCESMLIKVTEFHSQNPEKPYMTLESLKNAAVKDTARFMMMNVLHALIQHNKIVVDRNRIRLFDFKPQLTDDQQILQNKFLAFLGEKGAEGPTIDEACSHLKTDSDILQKTIVPLLAQDSVVLVGGTFYYTCERLDTIETTVRNSIVKEGSITLAEFRNALGTSRKYALPLLNYFDDRGVTLRTGDIRILK